MLDTKPIKLFFKYAIPSIFGLLAVSSASIIDGLFVGNYVGSIGLAEFLTLLVALYLFSKNSTKSFSF